VNHGSDSQYLMEHPEESHRLDIKTKGKAVAEQALFAGIKPGMRVLDVGCGSGKTTSILHGLVQPGGESIGIDISENRITYAQNSYESTGPQFIQRDMRHVLDDLGKFDFLWIRFVLEYYKAEAWPIVKHLEKSLSPGGIFCLIDLDHNCMSHFEMPKRLEETLQEIFEIGQTKANFDPYAGRKLYSYLYRLNFSDIRAHVEAHHLIYGVLDDVDSYNWLKKIQVGIKRIDFDFHRYNSGYEEFADEFMTFFSDPKRFTYTPLISVSGRKNDNDGG
jgi:ubiquinone/menaquinone biosynthesis C-methylase UbiE